MDALREGDCGGSPSLETGCGRAAGGSGVDVLEGKESGGFENGAWRERRWEVVFLKSCEVSAFRIGTGDGLAGCAGG